MSPEAHAAPAAPPDFHLFDTEDGPHLLLVDGSQLFRIEPALAQRLAASSGAESRALLAAHGLGRVRFIGDEPLRAPPLRALSLAVAQRCNLGCTYCYAEGGSFGESARSMPWDVAQASLQRLFSDVSEGERVNLAFMGGEPLANREVIRRATALAVELARQRGVPIGFSLTTNGTLLTRDDAEFFEAHGFAVTVSLDGVGAVHDALRPLRGAQGARGSYERIVARVQPLLALQRRMQVSARVTVTPANLALRETLDEFVRLGFWSVGFSPMLSAPSHSGEMQPADLRELLAQMRACGQEFERRVAAGEAYPFANLQSALEEVHRGTHRPYPCGAGAGYLGVAADGKLHACHRFVGDEQAAMGDVRSGVDRRRQAIWLAERAVDRQQPCSSCWARYLCGGGCHYEALHRGRPACDYIRGWLEYAIGAYLRLCRADPAAFDGPLPGSRRPAPQPVPDGVPG